MKLSNGREIGPGHPTYVIAEIGINHNGDLELCGELIAAAKDAGADAVKFQKRTVDIVYTPEELAAPRQSPFGETNGDLKRGLEFGRDGYDFIDRTCKQVGIDWSASCWDVPSLEFIEGYNPPWHKVAGPRVGHRGLLHRIAKYKRPVCISCGMSTRDELLEACSVIIDIGCNAIPMHCVSSYPTLPQDTNLRFIADYCGHIGYSGHELGMAISIAAVALGACVIERHFTIDRNLWGSDHKVSLESTEFAEMVKGIREVEAALSGTGSRRSGIYDCERGAREKLWRTTDGGEKDCDSGQGTGQPCGSTAG
jgi:N-acetylneuraminate synthase